jgi:hypothetical protein
MWRCEQDSAGLGYEPMSIPCEDGSVFKFRKTFEFINQLSDTEPHKMDSSQWC